MAGANGDAGGLRWIASELARAFGDIGRERKAVSWATIREWRRLARTTVPYVPPASS
jgi:hypothetical protein